MKTFEKLTKDFSYVNPSIEENFKFEEPRNSEYKVFHFNRYISSEDAVKEIQKNGYLPATLGELLNWADGNREYLVVSLGSVGKVDGDRCVPCLSRYGSRRYLGLNWWDDGWYDDCRFLAVRNLELKTSESLETELGHSDTLTLENAVKICKEAGLTVTKTY